MKMARLFTLLGSVLLIIASAFHAVGYTKGLLPLMEKSTMTPPLPAVLKAMWWCFSVFLFTLATIALQARSMERGGRIIVVAAASCAVTLALILYFVGPFIGAYMVMGDMVLLAVGGVLQLKAEANQKLETRS